MVTMGSTVRTTAVIRPCALAAFTWPLSWKRSRMTRERFLRISPKLPPVNRCNNTAETKNRTSMSGTRTASLRIATSSGAPRLPGFRFFRLPGRALVVAVFPLAFLAGATTDALVRSGWAPEARRTLRPAAGLLEQGGVLGRGFGGGEQAVEAARRIIRDSNCQGCHILDGAGGGIRQSIARTLMEGGMTEEEAQLTVPAFSPPMSSSPRRRNCSRGSEAGQSLRVGLSNLQVVNP